MYNDLFIPLTPEILYWYNSEFLANDT